MNAQQLKTAKNETLKTIIFTIGAKGGAGKTLIMAHLARLLILLGLSVRVYDFEPVAGTGLSRMFKGAIKRSLEKVRELDEVVNGVVANVGSANITLVDLPSNAGDAFLKWAQVLDCSLLEGRCVRIILVLVLSDDADSFACAQRWISALGKGVRFVVVYNHGRGEDFLAFKNSRQGIDFIADYKPLEIRFPAIPEYLITPLRNEGLTLFDAIDDKGEAIKASGIEHDFMNFLRIKQCQGDVERAMKPMIDLIKT